MTIGVRREDKNIWERRTPLTPDDIGALRSSGLAFHVQPSTIRAFADQDYAAVGAEIREDLSACDLVLGIKEIPVQYFRPGGAYMFFSHVIKGQHHNMPMLRHLLDTRGTLFDYELVVDENGRRLLFFGRYAGLAGMIDTLHALGVRYADEGIATPFQDVHMAHAYGNLGAAQQAVRAVGERIRRDGLPASITPLVVGLSGYGNVSLGAQEILDLLPVQTIPPAALPGLRRRPDVSSRAVYKVVFREEDMVVPRDPNATFALQDYYGSPDKYAPAFDRYTPHLNVLVNCIFWTERYPRLITRQFARSLFSAGEPALRVIGDISCDIDGSIEFTVKVTDPAKPCFVYDPLTDQIRDGMSGRGIVVMAVDNLPCELPIEASQYFGRTLRPFMSEFAAADLSAPFEKLAIPEPLRRAIIAYRGELRPGFRYLEDAMHAAGA